MESTILYLAPLLGITNHIYRNAFQHFFPGIDSYFAPFIYFHKAATTNFYKIKSLQPENNQNISLIPQILSNDAQDFLPSALKLYQLSYHEINWNLGCPFPMVARKRRGSGLLPYPEIIATLLEKVCPHFPGSLSVKVRLGRNHPGELKNLIPIFNQFPLKEVIIHPRIGIQMYKGNVDLKTFADYLPQLKHPVVYNGDIFCYQDFVNRKERFPQITTWMLGRGAIRNPFLPWQIKNQTDSFPDNRYQLIFKFHQELLQQYSEELSGTAHLLSKMKEIWSFLAFSFSEPELLFKEIKRLKHIDQYYILINKLFSQLF